MAARFRFSGLIRRHPRTLRRRPPMITSGSRIYVFVALAGLLTLSRADAQQAPAPSAPNPYLMGTEGYDKGPRGLTSYMPVASVQPFAAQMAADVAAKPGIEREHQALLHE